MGAVGVSTSGSLLLSIMGHWIAFLATFSIAYFSSEADAVFTPLKNNYDFACVAENLKASETYYCDSQGHVRCLPGWSDEASLCTVPVCDVAVNGVNETCVHGMCTKPFTCECDIGWFGQRCEKCVTLPGCLYGTCENALECKCHPGYEGMLCDKPSCPGCVHGDCLMPNMCTCNPGWTGANCTECMTRPDCQFGRCVNQPFECLCDCGFEGVNCEKPRCKDGCHPQNGFCDLPDECRCKPGWTGEDCSECMKAEPCVHGTCQKPFECNCDEGFFGTNCNSTISTVDGNWSEWSNWGVCSQSCGGGTQFRKRSCDNPAPVGNGTYCSHDGSLCTEVQDCNVGVACVEEDNEDNNYGDFGAAVQPRPSNADVTSNLEVNPATNFDQLLDVRQINQEDAERIGLNDLPASLNSQLNSRFEDNEEDY